MTPWIRSKGFDFLWILSPPFFSVLFVALYTHFEGADAAVSSLQWVVLILLVDVAHVYSTLFRTYLDPVEFAERRNLYLILPLIAWALGCLFYFAGALYFWRALAYIAVFHFIRQQYGFFRLYARSELEMGKVERWIDAVAIYGAALWPILYWHTHLPRDFHWFVADDFVAAPWPELSVIAGAVYLTSLILYIAKEIIAYQKQRPFNVAKHLLLLGTALSWYVGIVHYNGDLAFTATNTLAHGIPYMALVWGYERRKEGTGFFSLAQSGRGALSALLIFFGVIVLAACLEEGLWESLVWRSHQQEAGRGVLGFFQFLPGVRDPETLGWLVPLLALPQLTHYLLDGFIWRIRGAHTGWLKRIEA